MSREESRGESMELASVSAAGSQSLLQSRDFPNSIRKKRNGCLIRALIWLLVGLVACGASVVVTPECPNQTPRMTTSSLLCQYRWKLGNFTCNHSCCEVPEMGEGEMCAVCFYDGSCVTEACTPAISQLDYALGKMLQYVGPVFVWIVFMLVVIFARAACRSNPAERRTLLKAAGVFVVVILFMFLLSGFYLFTDCHQNFRGLADVLLSISLLSLLNFFTLVVRVIFLNAAVPKLDRLLTVMAEAGNRRDTESLLLMDVGEDRLRSFWQGQLQEDFTFSYNVTQSSPWLTYCSLVIILLFPILFIYIWGARATLFLSLFWFQLSLRIAAFYVLKRPGFQQWRRRRKVKAQLANLPPKLTIVLFHNKLPEGLEEPPPPQDFYYMSAAFFSETEVFIQHAPGDGQASTPSLYTRSSIVQSDDGWRLCFVTSSRRTQQTLFQTTSVEVEVPQFFPLEAQDVQRAREWLASHEVFHFEADTS